MSAVGDVSPTKASVFSPNGARTKKVHFVFNAWGFSEVIIPKGNFSDCNHTQ